MKIFSNIIIERLFGSHVMPKSRAGIVDRVILGELIKDIDGCNVAGSVNKEIKSLTYDSRKVIPGSLFFAIPGIKDDGAKYIVEALSRGAVAVVSTQPCDLPTHISFVQVLDVRQVMALIARRFYDFPDQALNLIGVTGTNGKTTVSTLSHFLLQEPHYPVGLLGTIGYNLGIKTVAASRTTPESVYLQDMFVQMINANCKTAIMEVSSHAVALDRVFNVEFDVAVFLNLSEEHLDYHGSMQSYYEDKKKLFTGATGNIPKTAIINTDDRYGEQLINEIPDSVRVITFGVNEHAIIRAKNIQLSPNGIQFTLISPDGFFNITSPLLGHFNVSNILASIAIAWVNGCDLNDIATKINQFQGVPGRIEKVVAGQPFNVLVDYAHTPDALHNALTMLREITPGRILVVFGCGGDRDPQKRPLMTAAVQKLADHAWATADNPRTEPQSNIFEDMQAGVTSPDAISFIPDRRQAIHLALQAAQPDDCVLIAGKGHENYQLIGHTTIPFDDREVARELLSLNSSCV